ncbi:right-handed parallel beta-helix repeat-containing protein [Luteolibacter marinus]|uniref:right-handed parallel beta-helix repeat-containing protein n=1 Tax=Luteolibacter marinus TaxID=2776705 RepID=UPI001868E462|nr:right-handed parallel beta-helix repeat-containing protein [Luteolibacter marinus]
MKRSFLALGASLAALATAPADITITGDVTDATGTFTLSINAPITLEMTGTTNPAFLVFNEWVTTDGTRTATITSPADQALEFTVISGESQTSGTAGINLLVDNHHLRSFSVSANDPLFSFSNHIPSTRGDTVIIPPQSVTFAGNPAFNPALSNSTFTGDVFLAAGSDFRRVSSIEAVHLVVDTASDIDDGDFSPGNLSLREAIGLANETGADVISFDPSLSGSTITLTGGQLEISSSMTIAGPGADVLTISGGGASRIFAEVGDGQGLISISDLTLADGNSNEDDERGGGAFFSNGGAVTLNRVVMRNNSSQANSGSTIVIHFGTLDINGCAIVDNLTTGVGAIRVRESRATITNTTISNNQTRAISFFSQITSGNDRLSLTNVTISGNSLGGIEIIADAGPILFEYQNTIFTDNGDSNITAVTGGVAGVSIVSLGNNLLDDSPEGDAAHPAAAGDQRDSDPRIAPLGDYGGPTPTSPPLPGSPAIEGGAAVEGVTVDQRGSARISGSFPDIGAVEAFPFSLLPLVDTADGDGIDDRIETGIFGNTTTANGSTDTDGDGRSDREEIANMTDPLDATDFFRILGITPAAGFDPVSNPLFEVAVKTFPGLDYELQLLEDLEPPTPPALARTVEIVETGSFVEVVTVLMNPGRDFLRAVRK